MKKYIYETHMHTVQASACGHTPGHEYISRYIDAGYSGIIITDHFYRGNCGVDRTLPWPEFVRRFASGYEDALNEGIRQGLDVFFGWEENYEGDEYLIYGLDPDWMLAHPEMPTWTRLEQYTAVRAAGGAVVQAHPFRARRYISCIHLAPLLCDAIEAVNAWNEPEWNSQALRYGQILGLKLTGGSDNHDVKKITAEKLGGVELDAPLSSCRDYANAILGDARIGVRIPMELPEWKPEMKPTLPSEVLDAQGNHTALDINELLQGQPLAAGELQALLRG